MLEDRRIKDLKVLQSFNKIRKKEEKNMKKMMKLMLAMIVAMLLLAGCGSATDSNAPAPANKLEEILAKGTLVLATSPDYAPMEFIDLNKTGQEQYVGSDIELAKYIAEQLGVKLEIKAMDFSTVLAAVDLGQADIAISGFGWKADRDESFELSIGFNQSGESACQGLMVKADKVDQYKTLADFAGLKIVAQPGSLQEGYVNDQISDADLQLVADLTTAVLMLKTDKVEAFACSCDQMDAYAKANPEIARSTVEFDTTAESLHDGNVLAVKKGETELIAKINEILTKVNDEDLYEQWSKDAKALAAALGLEFED